MQAPDTRDLFPEIPEGHFRNAILAAWQDGYRTRDFELRSAALEAAIAKVDLLIEKTAKTGA